MDDQHYILTCIIKNKSIASWNEDHKLIIRGDCYKKFNNLLKQDFTAIRPNEKWCTDFTYLYLSDGAKRYNCSIIILRWKVFMEHLSRNLYDRIVLKQIMS